MRQQFKQVCALAALTAQKRSGCGHTAIAKPF